MWHYYSVLFIFCLYILLCKNKKLYIHKELWFMLWFFSLLVNTLVERKRFVEPSIILHPLQAFILIWKQQWISHSQYNAYGIVGNILLFVPLGLFISNCSDRWKYLLPFILSFAIESIQYSTRLGTFEVDDLICNTIGGILGYELGKQISGQRKGNFIIPGIYLAVLGLCCLKSILFN